MFVSSAEESLIFATEAGNIDIIKLLLDENIKFLEKKNQNGVGNDIFWSLELKKIDKS